MESNQNTGTLNFGFRLPKARIPVGSLLVDSALLNNFLSGGGAGVGRGIPVYARPNRNLSVYLSVSENVLDLLECKVIR